MESESLKADTMHQVSSRSEVNGDSGDWEGYRSRYRHGEWRATIFRDMVLADMRSFPTAPVTLDIGCGSGFDDDLELQQAIMQAAGQYIGVDPDAAEGTQFHRTFFEDTPLEPESIDLAYSVMVLEHITDPVRFWNKLHCTLREGGIFWGFTVDARHWFRSASTLSERLRVKNLYLTMLKGRRGVNRYMNYPTCYLSNSPDRIRSNTQAFRSVEFINFQRVGQMDYYLPEVLRPLGRAIDGLEAYFGRPGILLAVRAIK